MASTIETRLSHTALTLVSEGVGITIIDPSSATDYQGRGVVVRPLAEFVDASLHGGSSQDPGSIMQRCLIN